MAAQLFSCVVAFAAEPVFPKEFPAPPVGFPPKGFPSDVQKSGLGLKFPGGSSGSHSFGYTGTTNQTQISNIANSGTQTYYGGVIQIAAGVTQVSRAAQNRNIYGSTEENRQELIRGLTNLAAGNESLMKAREVIAHANSIQTNDTRLNSAASKKSESPAFNLSFEKEKAGALANSVLNEMERVAEVPADSLIRSVNDDDNFYNLAAGAKGLDLSADDLASAADAAVAKAGRPANPDIMAGAKLSDVMKDIEMFMGKNTNPANTADAAQRTLASTTPTAATAAASGVPASASQDEINTFAKRETQAAPAPAGESSIFQMVSRQYRKRNFNIFSKAAI